MSTWIHITNLPLYYDDYGLQDIFSDIGQITATNVTKNNMIMKSTGFVQFANTKHAKLAASKKDQTVIANSAVRVYLLWTQQEDLSTIKVKNIEPQSTENDLEKYFDPYGGIVDIRIIHQQQNNKNNNNNNNDDEKIKEIDDKQKEEQEPYALISFCRVDYALQAVQEMNGTIIGMGGALSVELVNPDARNLKWKRNSFEYILMPIPEINTMNQYHHHHRHRHRHHRHNRNHHGRHNHNHHGYNNQHNQQYISNDNSSKNNTQQTNPNIIIVNNIGTIHNNTTINDEDSKNNQLLHPTYRSQGGARNDSHYRRHQNFNGDKQNQRPHSHSPNTTQRGRGRSNNDRRYRQHHEHNNNNDHHRHRRDHKNDHNNYQRNRHQRHDDKGRDRRARKYRSARSNQSTLLGPLHNLSNGQYRTYSVTPSPTRSDTSSSNDSHQHSNHLHHNPGLQRISSADSTSSSNSTHSLPANYGHATHYHQKHGSHKRRALDHYILHNNSAKPHHHSPQPFNPQQIPIQQQQQQTPVSPATTVSTPSTTHSMPTPTGYTTNSRSLISRSKTPTALSIPLTTPTILSNSSTTPVSTPPSAQALKYGAANPVFQPQTSLPLNALNPNVLNNVQMNNMNHLNNQNMMNLTNGMNAMTLNALNMNGMNGMVSPTTLSLPLQNMNIPTPTNASIPTTIQQTIPAKSPQAVTSPIVITPHHNFMIQQQLGAIPQCNAPNAKTTPIIISPPNTQQPFSFGSPTLLGPINTPPEPQKKFTFNGTNNNINTNNLSPNSNNSNHSGSSSSKKTKKSPSHSWTKEQEELGNKLYKIVASVYPERATKIVGMLLTGHSAEDLKFMVNRPNILMPLAKDYNEKQMAKDANKKK